MHRFWETIVRPTLEAAEPRVIVEIGVGAGEQSKLVLERSREWDSAVHLIDPSPEVDPSEWDAEYGSRLRFHRRRSLDVLPEIRSVDAVLIDGDHNWYTVINELRAVEQTALSEGRLPPVVLLHDVGWPYGRRDLYYDPDSIPAEYRHPYAQLGLDPDSGSLLESNGVNAYLYNAEEEDTPRNGVLTAVEDFVEESSIPHRLVLLPGVHGIAVLAAEPLLEINASLRRTLDGFGQADFLERHAQSIERDRIRMQVTLARVKAELDEHYARLERLKSGVELDHPRPVTPSAQLGAVEERLAAVTQDRVRLAAAIDRRDAEIEGMARRIEGLHGELRSGTRARARPREGATTEGDEVAPQAGEIRSIAEREARFARTFTKRYERLASRQRSIISAGGRDPLLAIDGMSLLVPGKTPGSTGSSIDVVVCIHNALPDVHRCLRSLLAAGDHPFHLIVVDDGSDEETANFLRWFAAQHPSVELIERREPPHGYTIAANAGLAASTGNYVVLLNSDTIVTPGWLEEIIEVGEADEEVGVVGPLSNAASHQSVPLVRTSGEWATNPAPPGITPDVIALLVRRASQGLRPRVPFINGFCYAIKRSVIDTVGTFDEETFAAGFGEENDYSIRTLDAGFELSIADRAYVHHAKSRSYGSTRRSEIARDHYQRLEDRHGQERVASLVAEIEGDASLASLRGRLAECLGDVDSLAEGFRALVPDPLEITFVLPGLSPGGGGGPHSIYQEAWGLRQLGVSAQIALKAEHLERAALAYPSHPELFRGYSNETELLDATAASDVIVATHFRSATQIARISKLRDDFVPAYYIQDYEPLFAMADTDPADEALLSYREIEGQLLFAKTEWLCSLVASLHGVSVAKVQPSLDSALFHNRGRPMREPGDPVLIVGMVRPRTVRRQPVGTLRILERLQRELGDRVQTMTFGCSPADLESHRDAGGPEPEHHGFLSREQVAELLREADIFVDGSVYQAFGRTGLEAMACGCVPVLPEIGGAGEYAVDGENALLVDTLDHKAAFRAVAELARDPERIDRLRATGIRTTGRYSVIASALSEYALFDASCRRREIPAAVGRLSESTSQ